MIYNENGAISIGEFELSKVFKDCMESINEFQNIYNDMMNSFRILNERETIMKDTDNLYNALPSIGGTQFDIERKVSLQNDNIFASKQKISGFDEQRAKLILESEDICKEYEAWASLDFKLLLDKYHLVVADEKNTGMENSLLLTYAKLVDKGMTPSEIQNYILKNFYNISDDPEDIKKLLHLRLNYNKKMISLYQKMLKLNYDVLNLSKQEAEELSKNANTSEGKEKIKQIILDNKDKFIKRNGRFFDLRELGFGVMFIQNGKTGLEWTHTLDRVLDNLIRYDVCFLTHGKYNAFNIKNILNKEFRQETMFFIKYWIKYCSLTIKMSNYNISDEEQDKLMQERNNIQNEMQKRFDLGTNDPMFGPKGKFARWVCMPIRTELAGPFTNVNKLVAQCIKEARLNKQKYNMIGSKNNVHIMIMCCNPGSIPLDKSITSQKDVHIHYGKNCVVAEDYSLDNTLNILNETENNLKMFCKSIGIDYNDDLYLQECYENVDKNIDMLYEMSVKEIWDSVVAFGKKVWAAIVAAFKWIGGIIMDFIRKIKSMIHDKDAEVQDVSFIAIESAKMKTYKNQTIGEIQYNIEKSCNNISRNINKLQQTQTSIMKKIDDDLSRKARIN